MKKSIIIFGILMLGLLAGCTSTKKGVSPYFKFETECLGTSHDGTLILRAWGSGINRDAAKTEAARNAVYDVVFRGNLKHAGNDVDIRPLVANVNTREKNQGYFDAFFGEGGDYLKYVTMETRKPRRSRVKERNQNGFKYGVVVYVDRSSLKNRLRQDGIIK